MNVEHNIANLEVDGSRPRTDLSVNGPLSPSFAGSTGGGGDLSGHSVSELGTSRESVSLEEMLTARERRVRRQEQLLKEFQVPLISFTMNIPGPVKVFGCIPEAFEQGCQAIENVLREERIPVLSREALREKTGYEAIFCADASPERLKERMASLEERDLTGRLYDIDVLRINGVKVSREELGLAPRTCLLCGEPAHACSRSRAHSVGELIARIREILGMCPGDL